VVDLVKLVAKAFVRIRLVDSDRPLEDLTVNRDLEEGLLLVFRPRKSSGVDYSGVELGKEILKVALPLLHGIYPYEGPLLSLKVGESFV
jgi:hypothetical protein